MGIFLGPYLKATICSISRTSRFQRRRPPGWRYCDHGASSPTQRPRFCAPAGGEAAQLGPFPRFPGLSVYILARLCGLASGDLSLAAELESKSSAPSPTAVCRSMGSFVVPACSLREAQTTNCPASGHAMNLKASCFWVYTKCSSLMFLSSKSPHAGFATSGS